MDFIEFLNSFITLLVITNPLSALSAVLKVTKNNSLEDKKMIGLTAGFAVGVILLVITWVGKPLLMLLGIKIPAFQVAGGLILFLMALSMLNAEESTIKQTPEEQKEKIPASKTGAIVPLAIPIIAGPGAISTVIVNVGEFPGPLNQLFLSASAILVALCMGALLYFASNLEKILGQSGINIINRIGGLLLTAISIQTIANGLIGLFPRLVAA